MNGTQDFYKVLKLHRTATQNEIKDAYRKMAMILHPDRNDGCEIKGNQFKQATEAYQVLSDNSKRKAHDKILNGYTKKSSAFGGPMPDYRKVYAPQPPPGFKTFDPKKHYSMHYGDGMMKEEIDRARKRAERASGRKGFGYEYESPLGEGFNFVEGKGGNPFRSTRLDNKKRNPPRYGGMGKREETITYEEGYMDMGSSNFMSSKSKIRGREILSERMQQRRRMRTRNRGDPLYHERDDSSCVVM